MIFYPESLPGYGFEIDVEDPGYGRLWIRRVTPCELGERVHLAGPQLGAFLSELTAAALEDRAPALPWRLGDHELALTAEDVRLLLPSFGRAVLLAAAGTDRYDRTHADPDHPEDEPLCVSCNEGSPYSGAVTISQWCTERGHTPYGARYGAPWPTTTRHVRQETP